MDIDSEGVAVFGRLGRLVVHHPWYVIGVWIVGVVAIVSLAPTLDDVTGGDQASFLPDSYESVEADDLAAEAFREEFDTTVTVVYTRRDSAPLTDADRETVEEVTNTIDGAGIDRVVTARTGSESVAPNGEVALATAGLEGVPGQEPEVTDAVRELRDHLGSQLAGTDLQARVAGEAALVLDTEDAYDDALSVVALATIGLIIVLLLAIYRSPIAALLPIVVVGLVSTVAPPIIAATATAFDLTVDQMLPTILTVVLFGIGTDYILFLVFRFRERLRAGDHPKEAMIVAVERVGEAIASAAGVVIVAFLALLLAVFEAFTSLGPGLAIGVAVMLLAALTLVPAIISLLGTTLFWPSRSWRRTPRGSTFQGLGRFVARAPGVTALASGGLLVLLALGNLGLSISYDQVGQLPEGSESAEAFDDLTRGFPAGALNPTTVYLRSDDEDPLDQAQVQDYAERLGDVEGVASIMPAQDGQTGDLAQFTADGTVAQIDLLLSGTTYSDEAMDAVAGPVRDTAHDLAPGDTTALVGGLTSSFVDIRDATNRDMAVIFPVAGLAIAVILGLLLRSVVAPWYLMLAVIVNYLATLGAAVLVFQGIGTSEGITFSMPIILYLFVVAIGTDYNILVVARLREEAREGNEPRAAADLAVEHAGTSIAAAGVILAGTFASLLLSGISFLTEMGFSVSTGIVLAAFVMALFLVPGITALVGHTAWWPGHADRPDHEERPSLPNRA